MIIISSLETSQFESVWHAIKTLQSLIFTQLQFGLHNLFIHCLNRSSANYMRSLILVEGSYTVWTELVVDNTFHRMVPINILLWLSIFILHQSVL